MVTNEQARTITPSEFTRQVKAGLIPPYAPAGCSVFGSGHWDHSTFDCLRARTGVTDCGMFGIVYVEWVERLAEWIGDRHVLEIMAGRGWLARALLDAGVQVTATDDHSWAKARNWGEPLAEVLGQNAVAAAALSPKCDVLLCSWPYMDQTMTEACEAWGKDRPIVYIGEPDGGCTASDTFFDGFERDKAAPEIELLTWPGIHDEIWIGHWRGE